MMTVGQLIAELQKLVDLNPDIAKSWVMTEGCDCYGQVKKVTLDEDGVTIERER